MAKIYHFQRWALNENNLDAEVHEKINLIICVKNNFQVRCRAESTISNSYLSFMLSWSLPSWSIFHSLTIYFPVIFCDIRAFKDQFNVTGNEVFLWLIEGGGEEGVLYVLLAKV